MLQQPPDTLRAILDSVFAAPRYRWVERPGAAGSLQRWLHSVPGWLQALHDAHPLGYRLVLLAAVAILVAILVHVGWILWHTITSGSHRATATPAADRRWRDEAWYRREADRLAAEGRFADAIQADFMALVLALDARRILTFHPSKTPAEYAAETRLSPAAGLAFRDLVRTLYGYAFARWPCSSRDFSAWRARAAVDRYATAN